MEMVIPLYKWLFLCRNDQLSVDQQNYALILASYHHFVISALFTYNLNNPVDYTEKKTGLTTKRERFHSSQTSCLTGTLP